MLVPREWLTGYVSDRLDMLGVVFAPDHYAGARLLSAAKPPDDDAAEAAEKLAKEIDRMEREVDALSEEADGLREEADDLEERANRLSDKAEAKRRELREMHHSWAAESEATQ